LKVTLNWIKEFLDTDSLDPEKIASMLTMSGTEVKKIENVGIKYKNIITGKILESRKHPDADKLSVCVVGTGSRKLNIVCGAKNFKTGDRVAVALPGAIIKDLTIKKSRIRGQVSEGMMCSEMELGLSSESEGIMILDDSFRVGESFAESAGLNDFVYEFEITPNRPDCLSVIGIAREISALTGLNFRVPDYNLKKRLNMDSDFIIEIKDPGLCSRYSAGIFNNIPDMGSPWWLKNRLIMCDIRPVSIVVDLTNYVMLETGQPMHAFDRDLLYSNKITVRKAKKGEKIKTIDGSLRILDDDSLIIADESKPVGIAGIMGGKNTEINPGTRNVLLESANFYGPSIMRTSKKMGLRSEASNRFEKKIDPNLTLFAIGRFESIVSEIAGFDINARLYDNYHNNIKRQRKINLRVKNVSKTLGKRISKNLISEILDGLKIENKIKNDVIEAAIPSFRYEDLEREVDLVEEIARIYEYDKLDSMPTPVSDRRGKYTYYQKKVREIRQHLCDIGLCEVINYSFINAREIKKFRLNLENEYRDAVEILNPINEDFKYLRTSLLPAFMKNIKDNINHNIKDIRIFEISTIFKKRNSDDLLPYEISKLGIILTGKAFQKSWNEAERNMDFYDLKGILEFMAGLYFPYGKLRIIEDKYKFFHPGISGSISINGKVMGVIGRVHPLIIEEMEIKQDVYYMELNLDDFINNMEEIKKYKTVPAFPSIEIDLAIVVDEKIKNEDIINEIRGSGTELLKDVHLFDIYRGKQIDKDKKSMAYSLSFRDDSRTLKDTEVDIIINRILENLRKKFNARIRDK
jgi:phenylalanyl-tRNA synthetase beta chain